MAASQTRQAAPLRRQRQRQPPRFWRTRPAPAPGAAIAVTARLTQVGTLTLPDGRVTWPSEEARAIRDEKLSIFLFEPAIGPLLKPGKLPKTEALFQKVKGDVSEPINTVKEYWK
jgi:hypothetical protein